MNFLIYEGPDDTGKTTIRKKLDAYFSPDWITVERFHWSHVVYDLKYERQDTDQVQKYFDIEQGLKNVFDRIVVVYLRMNPEESFKRNVEYDIFVNTAYEFAKKSSIFNVLEIDVSGISADEVAQKVKDYVNGI